MQLENGKIKFNPSTDINIIQEQFTDSRYVPNHQTLFFKGFYRVGNLNTTLGNQVMALEFIDKTLDIFLVEPIPETRQAKPIFVEHPHTMLLHFLNMPRSEIVPEYNCHGLCFANSLFRIADITQILKDEYQETTANDAYCIVFFENNFAVHSSLILSGKKVMSKGGYRSLNTYSNPLEAIPPEIDYDRYAFYKKREIN